MEEYPITPVRRREEALLVSCPRCNAVSGQPCMGGRGKQRRSVHLERLALGLKRRRQVKWKAKNG